ncbi:MAG: cyclodeaminase/cyclohydrolase family protein [Synergistaceae bacterium]|jgi:glutamate formiminotransferase/formiminotetrahydrofolate cyclodeaminase|nr:cyclodeaminase/cyclohydrolase family protein [Synergistaceae bacterium]
MSLGNETLNKFLDDLASDLPAPGGGSVAALGTSLACALISMVANLTVGREKYRANWEKMASVVEMSEQLRMKSLALMDEDVESFNAYMAALKMPKETDAQKSARASELEKTAKRAAEAPLSMLELCAKTAELALHAAEYGNPNTATDAGSAAVFAEAAGKAAAYNVRINLSGIKDEAFTAQAGERMERALAEIARNCKLTEAAMDKILK